MKASSICGKRISLSERLVLKRLSKSFTVHSLEKTREALEVLSAKAEKVKKHQAEAKAHVKNVRKGKKKS